MTAVAVFIACALVYLLLRHELRVEVAKLRAELAQQVASTETSAVPPPQNGHGSVPFPKEGDPHELDPKVLTAIGRTISTMLGREVRISPLNGKTRANGARDWAHAGYMAVQNSHDLGLKKKPVVGARYSPATLAQTQKRTVA